MAHLLSKTLDPLLGVFTGFLAYYLHETNPRTAPPPGHSMKELIQWQWEHSKRKRDEAAAAASAGENAELDAVRKEFEAAAAPVVASSAVGQQGQQQGQQTQQTQAQSQPQGQVAQAVAQSKKTEDRAV